MDPHRDTSHGTPDELESLGASVRGAGGKRVEGEVVEVGVAGAAVRFPREEAPSLAVGQTAELTLEAPWVAGPVELEARVLARVELPRHRRYTLRFERLAEQRGPLRDGLHSLFNRRREYRVDVPIADSVEVTLSGRCPDPRAGAGSLERSARGRLRDVSFGGLGLRVSPKDERPLAACERLKVSFRTPGSQQLVRFVVNVRNRRLVEDEVHYGTEIDVDESPRAAAHQETLAEYVMTRQRELLKVRNG